MLHVIASGLKLAFPFSHCQVRALFDEKGNRVDQAGPSIPVQVRSSITVFASWHSFFFLLNITNMHS